MISSWRERLRSFELAEKRAGRAHSHSIHPRLTGAAPARGACPADRITGVRCRLDHSLVRVALCRARAARLGLHRACGAGGRGLPEARRRLRQEAAARVSQAHARAVAQPVARLRSWGEAEPKEPPRQCHALARALAEWCLEVWQPTGAARAVVAGG